MLPLLFNRLTPIPHNFARTVFVHKDFSVGGARHPLLRRIALSHSHRAEFAADSPASRLRHTYRRHINPADIGGLIQLDTQWRQTRPLLQKKILFNGHMTWITLVMIEALLNAGAEVEVTVAPELVAHAPVLQALRESHTPFLSPIPTYKQSGYYDVIYDCGAGMRKVIPKIGRLELTHTNPAMEAASVVPVISVNLSQTKAIETRLGTGQSLVRVLSHWAQQALRAASTAETDPFKRAVLLQMVDPARLFAASRFMIWGYGQVGGGVAEALVKAGTPRAQIIVVDVHPPAVARAQQAGYIGLCLPSEGQTNESDLPKIRQAFQNLFAVITATGVPGAVAQYFRPKDFDAVSLLINMGTEDEFGAEFPAHRVAHDKKPANFLLPEPTEMIFLDAIFTLYLKAVEQLLGHPPLAAGLHPVSSTLDQAVLIQWWKRYRQTAQGQPTELTRIEQLWKTLRAEIGVVREPSRVCAPSSGFFASPHAPKVAYSDPDKASNRSTIRSFS